MKRFFVTILFMLYMFSALNLTVHVHYCMGKIASIGFDHSNEEKCGKCGMKKSERSKSCCQDDHKTFKANDHQQPNLTFDFSHNEAAVSVPAIPVVDRSPVAGYYNVPGIAYLPPLVRRSCPIYLFVQNFRI